MIYTTNFITPMACIWILIVPELALIDNWPTPPQLQQIQTQVQSFYTDPAQYYCIFLQPKFYSTIENEIYFEIFSFSSPLLCIPHICKYKLTVAVQCCQCWFPCYSCGTPHSISCHLTLSLLACWWSDLIQDSPCYLPDHLQRTLPIHLISRMGSYVSSPHL